MILGTVHGTVVSSLQHPFYDGRTQLIVRYVLPNGALDGEKYIVAIDTVGAGVGQTVLVQDEGTSARQSLGLSDSAPIRSLIVAIVDGVNEVPLSH